jgi:hypothetical protein
MTFESQIEHESKTFEGVRFTVRVLNNIQRAKRDLALLPQKAELTRLSAKLDDLRKQENFDTVEELRLDAEIGMLTNIHMKPALITAGLISITGAEGIANAADLIDHGPDDLIDEVYVACFMASGLTQQQQKNSSSQSDSLAPVAEQDLSTTATTAGQ